MSNSGMWRVRTKDRQVHFVGNNPTLPSEDSWSYGTIFWSAGNEFSDFYIYNPTKWNRFKGRVRWIVTGGFWQKLRRWLGRSKKSKVERPPEKEMLLWHKVFVEGGGTFYYNDGQNKFFVKPTLWKRVKGWVGR